MMPLSYAEPGKETIICRVGGNSEIRKHMEDLGFTVGACVTVITEMAGNLVVRVRETRVAVSREMAGKIMIE